MSQATGVYGTIWPTGQQSAPGHRHARVTAHRSSPRDASTAVEASNPHATRPLIDRALAVLPAATATFLSKLSVPPFGALGLSVAIPMLCTAGVAGLASSRLVVDPMRLVAYVLMLGLLVGIQLVQGDAFSLPSIVLLACLHFPYLLQLREPAPFAAVARQFQRMALFIAACGIGQYALQFVFGAQAVFPIENLVPEAFRVSAFNMQGYLEYGSELYRANGVFMLEPSFFSQLLAVAIVLELSTRRRAVVIGVLLAAIAVSYSGTGLMLLAACLPVLAIVQRRWGWLLVGALIAAVLVFIVTSVDNEYTRVFVRRASEFSSPGSSGFARFVGGFYLFDEFLWPDPMRTLFGFGAGSLQAYAARATLASGGNVLFKMVFEFGLAGGIGYFAFLFCCFARSSAPVMIRVAVALTFYLGGIYIPFAHGLAIGLLIWPGRHEPAQTPH